MTKIVPARRLVTDSSLEPPSIDPSRGITPVGRAVVDSASITATAGVPPRNPHECGDGRAYQLFVKIRLGGAKPVRSCAVIPGRGQSETNLESNHDRGSMDSGSAPSKSAFADLDNRYCRARVNP